jgi:hypothetical protein
VKEYYADNCVINGVKIGNNNNENDNNDEDDTSGEWNSLTLSAQQIALAVADEEIATDCSPKIQAVKEGRCPDGYSTVTTRVLEANVKKIKKGEE